jgi:hypothetical protein
MNNYFCSGTPSQGPCTRAHHISNSTDEYCKLIESLEERADIFPTWWDEEFTTLVLYKFFLFDREAFYSPSDFVGVGAEALVREQGRGDQNKIDKLRELGELR